MVYLKRPYHFKFCLSSTNFTWSIIEYIVSNTGKQKAILKIIFLEKCLYKRVNTVKRSKKNLFFLFFFFFFFFEKWDLLGYILQYLYFDKDAVLFCIYILVEKHKKVKSKPTVSQLSVQMAVSR